MITDLSLSSEVQLLNLINSTNNINLTLSKITFNTPTPLVGDVDGKNTEVIVEAVPNKGFSGTVSVKYKRNNLSQLEMYNNGDTIDLTLPKGSGLQEAVQSFNGLLGTNLEIGVDIDGSVAFPVVEDNQKEYSLTALSTSLAYTGAIVIRVEMATVPLSSIITVDILQGLTLPIIQQGQTITFNNPGNQNFGDTLTLIATASSGLSVTFSSLSPSVCTVDEDGVVTFLQTGSCAIRASQPGNEYYFAADNVDRLFSVNAVLPDNPTITGVSGGAGSVTVAFAAPDFNGGSAVIGYRAVANPGGFVATGTSSPISIGGLANNTQYTITLQAQTAVGYSSGVISNPVSTSNELAGILAANLTSEGVGQRLHGNPTVLNGRMYVTGTTSAGGTNNALRAYDLATNSWVTGIPTTTFGSGSNTIAMHSYNGRIYVFSSTTSAYRHYTTSTNTIAAAVLWTALSYGPGITSANLSSNIASVAAKDKYAYFLTAGLGSVLARVDLDTNQVVKLADAVFEEVPNGTSPRQVTMNVVGDNLYVLISRASQSPFEINVFYKLNLTTNTWTRLADIPSRIVYGYSVSNGGNYIYTYGGGTTANFSSRNNKLQKYDIALNQWSLVASVGANKAYNGLAWYQDKLYSYCGNDDTGISAHLDEFIRIE